VIKQEEIDGRCMLHLQGEKERGIRCFSGKTLGKEPLERSRRRWKGNIKNVSSSNRDKMRAIVNGVVNVRLHEKRGTS
jgi:hypothetical protein